MRSTLTADAMLHVMDNLDRNSLDAFTQTGKDFPRILEYVVQRLGSETKEDSEVHDINIEHFLTADGLGVKIVAWAVQKYPNPRTQCTHGLSKFIAEKMKRIAKNPSNFRI